MNFYLDSMLCSNLIKKNPDFTTLKRNITHFDKFLERWEYIHGELNKTQLGECKEPDDTGNYMNRVLDELKDNGYGISGYYFGGNGFYNVTVIKPYGEIGSSELEVLVNECGEILKIIE